MTKKVVEDGLIFMEKRNTRNIANALNPLSQWLGATNDRKKQENVTPQIYLAGKAAGTSVDYWGLYSNQISLWFSLILCRTRMCWEAGNECSSLYPCLDHELWFGLFCPLQGASSLPEETEAAVWDKAGDELSILTRCIWGRLCRVSIGNQSVSSGNQGRAECKHCNPPLTLQPRSTAAIRSCHGGGFMTQILKLQRLLCERNAFSVGYVKGRKRKIPKQSFPMNRKEPKIGNYLLFGFSFKGMRMFPEEIFFHFCCLSLRDLCMLALISRNAPGPKQSTESCFTFKACFRDIFMSSNETHWIVFYRHTCPAFIQLNILSVCFH